MAGFDAFYLIEKKCRRRMNKEKRGYYTKIVTPIKFTN